MLFFTGLTDGRILSKKARSTGLYFRSGLRIKKTRIAIAIENRESDSTVTAIIKTVISQKFMEPCGMCESLQRVCEADSKHTGAVQPGGIIFSRLPLFRWHWQPCSSRFL